MRISYKEPTVNPLLSFWHHFMTNTWRKGGSSLHPLPIPSLVFSHAISRLLHPSISPPPLSFIRKGHCFNTTTASHQERLATMREFYLESEQNKHVRHISKILSKVHAETNEDDVLQLFLSDPSCRGIQVSSHLVDKLLQRYEHEWKSALGLFRWASSQSGYRHTPEAYDKMVDILGKMKQMDRMWTLVEEMREFHLVTLKTIGKIMRRLAGAGKWKDAIKTFDDVGEFGLEKDTEAMNLLLDTLCKEKKVELAREVFLELKAHISPNAHTFNIFIHGWCKWNRIDEANWTIQEMKGHGIHPCVITYSTIIQAHCKQFNFHKAYEVLDEMVAQGCPPNVVTYTELMHSLAESEKIEDALQICKRIKSTGCKPDTLFYNALIHILGRAGQLCEASRVFEAEMCMNGIFPNLSTYNTMIAMFCRHSQEQNALNVLRKMETSGSCKPDLQTYNPLLKLCFKMGKTDNNLSSLLDDMVNKHHLSLDLATYTLLIHGLCRANKCEWACLLLEEMITQEITPRYKTCRLLLDEVRQKNMYEVTERIEVLMRHMKNSAH